MPATAARNRERVGGAGGGGQQEVRESGHGAGGGGDAIAIERGELQAVEQRGDLGTGVVGA